MVFSLPMNIRALLFLLSFAYTAMAMGDGIRQIRFAPGTSSASVSDAVARGARQLYSFQARGGQSATITLTSVEKNAVFVVWRPGAKPTVREFIEIEGQTLVGAGEEDDANYWRGRLPDSGMYLIAIGSTRGNAAYELRLMVGKPTTRD